MSRKIIVGNNYVTNIKDLSDISSKLIDNETLDYATLIENNYLKNDNKYSLKQIQIIELYDNLQSVSQKWFSNYNRKDFEKMMLLQDKFDEECSRLNLLHRAFYDNEIKNRIIKNYNSIGDRVYPGFLKVNDNTVEMSPLEYIKHVAYDVFSITVFETVYESNVDNIYKYAFDMRNGSLFEPPWLDLKNKKQEGRHRAIAAFCNGISKIPVVMK